MKQRVRFDKALAEAIHFARAHLQELGGDVVIVRDLVGRIRLALSSSPPNITSLSGELDSLIGAFSPGRPQLFLVKDEMISPHAVFDAPELRRISPGISLLERWVTGNDWLREPLPKSGRQPNRITFFGIKGGVGRSTSLVAIARHLAEAGSRVLVLDLDLESPGITASLLPEAARPSFGIVDWFVEEDVGQADDELLREIVSTSPLASGTAGEIRVVPAAGTTGSDSYVSKLARMYASTPGQGDFASRLDRLVKKLEASELPDWVLIDSRAGLHDIAAVAVTRLQATSLLFAIDTPQTWLAYRFLFATWQKDPTLVSRFRSGLRVVAGQVPETERESYLSRLRDHANALCVEYLYDEADPDSDSAFNFDLKDPDAPHSPVPVYWRRELQDWDPTADPATVTSAQIEGAFGELFRFIDDIGLTASDV